MHRASRTVPLAPAETADGGKAPQKQRPPLENRPRRGRLEAVGIYAAVVGTVTALVVNSVQLTRQSGEIKRQTTQTRLQTAEFAEQTREFGVELLSRYYVQVTGATAVLHSRRLRQAAKEGLLSEADNERLSRYLRSSDYVAWLFNHGQLTLRGARARLSLGLKESYRLALSIYGPTAVERSFHDLTIFARS